MNEEFKPVCPRPGCYKPITWEQEMYKVIEKVGGVYVERFYHRYCPEG